jgi:hypothetical protein
MKRGRGRPKAQYKCEVSGRVCPFNDSYWDICGDSAKYECPIQAYENSNRRSKDGIALIIDDSCKHLIPRNSD